jgi:16S rRNA (uracil1498-N3)-methyltransferase
MAPRIFVAAPLAAGATIVLPRAESRHVQVLRLQPGDAIVLFNGEGDAEWPAEIVRIERAAVELKVGAAVVAGERELAIRVTLAFGIPANERMDGLVEKATELGVAAIQPLVCERSVVRLAGERAEARRAHWSAVAASASEQCGRVRVPRIGAALKIETWLDQLDESGAASIADRASRFVLSFDPSAALPARAFATNVDAASTDLLVLSGPEGGLAPHEESAAVERGFRRVTLGPRVLRADTAPIALLAWLVLAAAREGR